MIVVHLFGRPADLGPIVDLLRPKGIALIEDCAQAHFAEYRGKKIGTFGDLGCFSLQQSKQITCGDGGLTLVNREDLIERASLFIDKGRSRKAGRVHLFLGANYRMTELQGTVARAQLAKGPGLIAARRNAATSLSERLRKLPGIIVPQDPAGTNPSWWLYNFLIDEPRVGVSAGHFLRRIGNGGGARDAAVPAAPAVRGGRDRASATRSVRAAFRTALLPTTCRRRSKICPACRNSSAARSSSRGTAASRLATWTESRTP